MTVKEFYELTGGDYEEVISRLLDDRRAVKYLKLFAEGKYMENIKSALKRRDWEESFRNVHSLKGVALNLGLKSLFDICDEVCEILRPAKEPEVDLTDKIGTIESQVESLLREIKKL